MASPKHPFLAGRRQQDSCATPDRAASATLLQPYNWRLAPVVAVYIFKIPFSLPSGPINISMSVCSTMQPALLPLFILHSPGAPLLH